MKELSFHVHVTLHKGEDGDSDQIFDENVYLVLPPEVALGDATQSYLTGVANELVLRALTEAEKKDEPERVLS